MEVNINGYNVEGSDWQYRGGGVAIYVKSGLKYERMDDPLDPNIEVICIEFKLRRKLPCLLICAYRAPNQNIELLIDYLDDVIYEAQRTGKQIIIIGDLNCDFPNDSLPRTRALKEFLDIYKLTEIVCEPTRWTKTSQSLLDLIITSSPQLFSSVRVFHSVISDRFPIYGSMKTSDHKGKSKHHIITTRRIDVNRNHEELFNSLRKVLWNVMNVFDDPYDKLRPRSHDTGTKLNRYQNITVRTCSHDTDIISCRFAVSFTRCRYDYKILNYCWPCCSQSLAC